MLNTADPFTVALVVPEDAPRPIQHAAKIGPGLLCSALRDIRGRLRWALGVDGVNCPYCRVRLRLNG